MIDRAQNAASAPRQSIEQVILLTSFLSATLPKRSETQPTWRDWVQHHVEMRCADAPKSTYILGICLKVVRVGVSRES